ncbi:pyridoxal-phosphate dependent enzyme [Spirochaeta isovalerica]|uniref:Threonine synthase n=1 Tax=Spirochaeta isovalerica TaxID=150 RepID=A0A841RGC9_9SPIO|nr:pyridoxal-phosphate dependent enzyme [Spirochaeta isovalerica]MBB6481392.1 threonine synthase [Spirochaeta isovalerica]
MNKSGYTPLMRAKGLEKILDVGEIYLKLEGDNPYGHKYDRIGELLVRDAISGGFEKLIVDGPRAFIHSVLACAEQADISVKVPLFKGQMWKSKSMEKDILLDFRKVKQDEQESFVSGYCEEGGYYNCVNGYYNRHLSITALEAIGEEICEKLDSITSVFVQLSYGYTVSGLYGSFFRLWAKGRIEHYPRIFSCTIPKGNTIYEDYKRINSIPDIEEYGIRHNRYTRDLFIDNTQLLEKTLEAVKDTDGEIITVDETLLKEAAALLKTSEHISLTAEEAYSFAGFYKTARAGKLKRGVHVIVLNNGKTDIVVNRLQKDAEMSRETILSYVRTFLMEYSDSIEETSDAIDNALSSGAVFTAEIDGRMEGIAIVVRMGFEDFIPRYHLAYIGTRAGRKGRGIAGKLIEEIIQFSGGSLSLHVDLDNSRAKKLYEKFGFVHMYNRMIYKGDLL